MNATMNGRARKSLSEQIDRLDTLLDGLAENLNDAIAAAVEQAVKQVLVEVLTNPELQQRLPPAPAVVQPEPTGSRLLTRLADWGQRAVRWLGANARAAAAAVGGACAKATQACRKRWTAGRRHCAEAYQRAVRCCLTAWLLLHGLRHLAGFVAAAGVVGAAAGVGAYLLGPTMAAAISGVSGFVAALAVQLGLWLKQTLLHWASAER